MRARTRSSSLRGLNLSPHSSGLVAVSAFSEERAEGDVLEPELDAGLLTVDNKSLLASAWRPKAQALFSSLFSSWWAQNK
jgi:hypothetical protein